MNRIIITGKYKSRVIELDEKSLNKLKQSSFFDTFLDDFKEDNIIRTVHDDIFYQVITNFIKDINSAPENNIALTIIYSIFLDLKMDLSFLATTEITKKELAQLLPVLRDNHYLMRAFHNSLCKIDPVSLRILKKYSCRNYIFTMDDKFVKVYHHGKSIMDINRDKLKYESNSGDFYFGDGFGKMAYFSNNNIYIHCLDRRTLLKKIYGKSAKQIQIFDDKVYFLRGSKLFKYNMLHNVLKESGNMVCDGIVNSFLISPNEKEVLIIGYDSSKDLEDVEDVKGTIKIKSSSYAIFDLRKVFRGEKITFQTLKVFDSSDCFKVKTVNHEGTVAIEYTEHPKKIIDVYKINRNKLDLKLQLVSNDNIKYNISPDAKLLVATDGQKIEIHQIDTTKCIWQHSLKKSPLDILQVSPLNPIRNIDFLDPFHLYIDVECDGESKIYQFNLKSYLINLVHTGSLYSKVVHFTNSKLLSMIKN